MNSPQPPDAVRICRFPSQEVEMTSPLRRMRAGLALGTGLALLCACALAAAAQTTGTIRGKVTDATTGRPVDGAQLYVAGTDLGTLSNADGQYQFSVRAGTVELRSRRVGYADRKSTRLNSSHLVISYAVFCLKKKMRDRFHARDPRSMMLRFHTQTAGSTLTAQQPDNNIVRTAYQALAAVLGGTQSLHTNSTDEALSLPTEDSARVALRTQQILAYETGVADVVDPLAGSYYVESLTNTIEKQAWDYIEQIDALGGSVRAIDRGFMQAEIEPAPYDYPHPL